MTPTHHTPMAPTHHTPMTPTLPALPCCQVEADIQPFRGLLLGLFFVSTGSSININVLIKNWQTVVWILAGLLTVKTGIIACLGKAFGLTG